MTQHTSFQWQQTTGTTADLIAYPIHGEMFRYVRVVELGAGWFWVASIGAGTLIERGAAATKSEAMEKATRTYWLLEKLARR